MVARQETKYSVSELSILLASPSKTAFLERQPSFVPQESGNVPRSSNACRHLLSLGTWILYSLDNPARKSSMNQKKRLGTCKFGLSLVGLSCLLLQVQVNAAFKHPGLLHNQSDLDFIEQKVAAEEEPWMSGWKKLLESDISRLDWQPKASIDVLRGAYNKPDIGASDLEKDSAAAYSQALQWVVTGDPHHAEKAINIFNTWSSTLKTIGEHDAKLLVGMTGVNMINGAEIIRHTSSLWRNDDIARFEKMLLNVHYPVIKDFFDWANGNWDASMIQTMLSIGVFLDNEAIFQRAVKYFLEGKGNGSILNYFNNFGQCQESGRDQSHVQMGIGFLGTACEIAWKQGVDLYGAYDNRLALGFEYTAKYNLGYDVPFEPYSSIDGRYKHASISKRGRGRFRPIYERAYHHYHARMGLEMPYTRDVILKSRPEGWHIQHTSWGTLLNAGSVSKQPTIEVSSLAELREAVQRSNQTIVMKPGRYSLTELPRDSQSIQCSGSNNAIDLSGVYVNVPVGTTRRSYISLSGDNNVFRGGTFEDTYRNGLTKIEDFSAYNQDRSELARGLRGGPVLRVSGDNNTVAHTKLTVRGSFPYGYGSIYGIGRDNVYGLDKRCGILIKGENNTIDSCEVQQRAFGHAIYMQRPADKTTIRNTLVEGIMRPSKELYLETNPEDLPVRSEYKLPRQDNEPIPKDTMIPLAEDGIRVYTGGGSVTVENCIVKMMRGGIRVYLASQATVTDSIALDCGSTNFNLPRGGKITGSSGNFAYAPISDFRLARSGQEIELTILPSPHASGPHNVADILGDNHNIVFHRTEGPLATNLRPIVVEGDYSTIRNETEYPLTLQSSASENTVISFGPVTDHGTKNQVSHIEQPNDRMEKK